ncbi:MAG: HAD hydrolase-like protein, partial [Gammaproteobacteria bacterium]|nr:HAD hydrolase-like protein [Gammaproteobacteria bacterium]
MPARHDGILLDLDGTLWNAASASAKGWNEVGNELGILSADLKKSDIENVSGHPLEKCIGMLFPESAIQKYPNLVNALEKGERKIIEEEGGEFYQGIL